MRKHLILFSAVVLFAAPAHAGTKSADATTALKAFDIFCVESLKEGINAADYAAAKKLPELPKEDAVKFSPDGGRVFALPGLNGMAVLTTNPKFKSVCSVAIHQTDIAQFQKGLSQHFTAKRGYRLMREKRDGTQNITRSEYTGDVKGPIKLLITAADSPRPNGIQVLVTIGRVNE
jgi:hypothetical protein